MPFRTVRRSRILVGLAATLLAGLGSAPAALAFGTDEGPLAQIQAASLLIQKKTPNGMSTNLSFSVRPTETRIELDGKPIKATDLQRGWVVKVDWKYKEADDDKSPKVATLVTVKCEWLDGTLVQANERMATIQTTRDNRPATVQVMLTPITEFQRVDGKKLRELPKGTVVQAYVIVGSTPPVAMAFGKPKPPEATSQPGGPASQPASQPAEDGPPPASQPADR